MLAVQFFRDYNRLVSEHTACILMPFQAAFVSDPTHLDRTEPEPSQVPFSRCSITTCTICHCSVHRSDSCLTTATQLSLFCMNVDCLFSWTGCSVNVNVWDVDNLSYSKQEWLCKPFYRCVSMKCRYHMSCQTCIDTERHGHKHIEFSLQCGQ